MHGGVPRGGERATRPLCYFKTHGRHDAEQERSFEVSVLSCRGSRGNLAEGGHSHARSKPNCWEPEEY